MQNVSDRRLVRVSTPERWQRALGRAVENGIQVRQLAASGAWIATSGSDPDTAYDLTVVACTCRAGAEGDPVCQHRAALRVRLGMLALDPVAVEVAEVVVSGPVSTGCPACDGRGFFRKESRIFTGSTFRANCLACKGRGVRPADVAVA